MSHKKDEVLIIVLFCEVMPVEFVKFQNIKVMLS